MFFKWNISDSPACDCGFEEQTIDDIVNDCVSRKFDGGITELNNLTPHAIYWLQPMDIGL